MENTAFKFAAWPRWTGPTTGFFALIRANPIHLQCLNESLNCSFNCVCECKPNFLMSVPSAFPHHRRRTSQHRQDRRDPVLHGGPQHPHPHRQQQQLQRDVRVYARPQGGADPGQQARGLIGDPAQESGVKNCRPFVSQEEGRILISLNSSLCHLCFLTKLKP